MKINAFLIDDERKLTEVLTLKLKQFCPDITIVGSATNISDGYEMIESLRPDLVFLDISMPGGSGFDLLDRFDTLYFEVIFVTSYNEYAIKAFRKSAIDYLLKPLDSTDLIKAVHKAKEKITLKNSHERYQLLLGNLNSQSNKDKKIVVADQNNYRFVSISDIIRLEGWQKYTKIYTLLGEEMLSSHSIGHFKDLLSKDNFFATHRSHMVNMDCILSYHAEGTLTLKDGSTVPVARNKKQEFKELFLGG